MYYAPGAAHAPHHVPKEWADRYAGKFDDGWDAYRETVFARQKEIGLLPADAELSPRDPDVPEWASLSADERRLYARMMEVYAGLRLALRPPLRPHPRHARADRRARQHADHGHLRQRRLGRGRRRPARSTRCCFFNQVPESFEENLAQIDELGGTDGLQPLPVGLDVGRQHAVPALEARDLPRRRDRPVRPLLAGRDRGPRRDPRTQYAHAIDMVPTVLDALGIDAAGDDPRRRRSRRSRASASRTPSTRPTRRRSTRRQYFEMFGHRSIYHDGWRAVCPWPGADLHRGGAARPHVRRPDHAARSSTSSTASGWELYDIAADPTESVNVAAEHPEQAARADRAVVGGGRQVQGAADRRLGRSSGWRPSGRRSSKPRDALRLLPRRRRSCRRSRRRRSSTARTAIEADVEIPRRRRRGRPARPGRRRRRLSPSTSTDGELRFLYNYVGRDRFEVRRARRRSPPAGTRCASSSSRPARRTSATARASRGAASSTSTARWSAATDFPHTTPLFFELEGLSCGYDFGAPAAEYEPPFAFTGTIHQRHGRPLRRADRATTRPSCSC